MMAINLFVGFCKFYKKFFVGLLRVIDMFHPLL